MNNTETETTEKLAAFTSEEKRESETGKRYKFILVLPGGGEINSAVEIEGYVYRPSYSRAELVECRGIFDSYDEAKEYASNLIVYQWAIYREEENGHFAASDSICYSLDKALVKGYFFHLLARRITLAKDLIFLQE